MAISPDGDTIVSGGEDATVRVWDVRTRRNENTLLGNRTPVRTVAYDAIGKRVVSGSQGGELREFTKVHSDVAIVAVDRLPVPSEEAQIAAKKLVVEVFAANIENAKAPSEKLAAADLLLTQAAKSEDAVERFVLIDEAKKLAIEAGDVQRAISNVRELAERYDFDVWSETSDTFDKLTKSITANTYRKKLAEIALEEAERAVAEDQYEAARQILLAALSAAKKTGNTVLIREIVTQGKEVGELSKNFELVQKAEETLSASPDDTDANLVMGKHLCLMRDQWPTGLRHLVKCSDEKLIGAAKQELASPAAAEEQVTIADAWWDCATTIEDIYKAAMIARAEFWYRKAMPQLSGLALTKVEKRVEEIAGLQNTPDASGAPTARTPSDAAAAHSLAVKVRIAVRAGKLLRTNLYGSRDPRMLFTEVPTAGLLLSGFHYSVENNSRVISVQPLYLSTKGAFPGGIYGNPTLGVTGKAEAPKGYAVGGIEVYGENLVWGFTLIYMKLTKTGLDPNDTQRSELIGRRTGGQQQVEILGANGQPVVGVFGVASKGGSLQGIGLVQMAK